MCPTTVRVSWTGISSTETPILLTWQKRYETLLLELSHGKGCPLSLLKSAENFN